MFKRRRSDGFNSFSLGEFFSRRMRMVSRWLGRSSDSAHSMRAERSALGSVLAFLFWPFRLLFAFVTFLIQSWAVSRHGWAFLRGVPAVLAIAGLLTGLWAANFLRKSRSVEASQAYFQKFSEERPDEPGIAEMFAEKLVDLEPEDDSYKYQLANAQLRSGKSLQALDIMKFLAPEDQVRYPDAHVWLAQHYLGGAPDLSAEQRDQIVNRHLDLALGKDPDNLFAHVSLAGLFEMKANEHEKGSVEYLENYEVAIDHLRTVVTKELDPNPSTALNEMIRKLRPTSSWIRVLVVLDRTTEAKYRVKNVISQFLPIARRFPDFPQTWESLIDCCVKVKDFDQAHKIIAEGLQLVREPEVRNMMTQWSAEIALAEALSYADMKNRADYGERLNLLTQALKEHPRNRRVYSQLLRYIASESNADFNEEFLQDSIVGNANPGTVHVLLGMLKIIQGNVLEGQKHWRIAEQQLPTTPIVVNNLIDVGFADYPDDFPRMLDVVTLAIEMFPDQTLLYQTRGVLHQKSGDYRAAISDFEYAAQKMPQLLTLQQHLVNCYRKLGQDDKADELEYAISTIIGEMEFDDRRRAEMTLKQLD
jgi:pentatricopeptide repeat protein